MNILVTGGTVFASRFTAEYFVRKGHIVYVLNRGNLPQSEGVIHIQADRHNLGDVLKSYHFDAVLDVTGYNSSDVDALLNGLDNFDCYVFVSSSAVYPETLTQPFCEEQPCGENKYWGGYGLGKVEAEQLLQKRVPNAYIIRPPYLYGEMNNVYRESFVFDCAEKDRPFYVPKDGKMPLQFFDIEDMCRFIEILLEKKPDNRIYNVGNSRLVDINEWVALCYSIIGKTPELKYVDESIFQRNYFPFIDYAYTLDVGKMKELMPDTKPLIDGLKQSYKWYMTHRDQVRKKPLLEYIDKNF